MSTAIHDFAPEEIMAHHDGELPADRAQQISAHLESCAECRDLAHSLGTTSDMLSHWTIDLAASRLTPKLPAAIRNSGNSIDFSTFWQGLHNRRMAVALGIAVSTIAFLFVEIETPRSHDFRSSATDVTPLEISDYTVRPPGAAPRAGGGGGGVDRELVPASRGRAPQFEPAPHPTSPAHSEQEDDKTATAGEPLIARTAELRIVATGFNTARTALESILTRHHGYAASLSVGDAENIARTLNASLRIPSPELPAVLNELKSLGHVANESQAGEEVTAEHADLVARLKNSRETETRLQDILRTRTGKVGDVLEVEQEIARVRGEIEQMESELKGLDHRVDFATINLTITEEYKAKVGDTTPGVATRFHNAAVAGLTNVTDSAVGLILWFTEFLPPMIFWLAILATPIAIFWRLRRRAIAAVSASPLA
jgi:hypothetical protein